MRFGLWNVRSLYRAGSLMTVSRELVRYKLGLVGVQETDERAVAPNVQDNKNNELGKRKRIFSNKIQVAKTGSKITRHHRNTNVKCLVNLRIEIALEPLSQECC
jgi:hypothetical protein